MRTVRMVTAIPKALAMELREKKRIINFNTLPQLHPKLIDSIKKYFEEVVGYHDSPIACLSRVGHKDSTIKSPGIEYARGLYSVYWIRGLAEFLTRPYRL